MTLLIQKKKEKKTLNHPLRNKVIKLFINGYEDTDDAAKFHVLVLSRLTAVIFVCHNSREHNMCKNPKPFQKVYTHIHIITDYFRNVSLEKQNI